MKVLKNLTPFISRSFSEDLNLGDKSLNFNFNRNLNLNLNRNLVTLSEAFRRVEGLILIFTFFLFASCSSDSKRKKTENSASAEIKTEEIVFTAGNIYPSLAIPNASESYALYLPKSYKKGEAIQLLVCLDPQGNGKLPLDLYRNLADTFNWVLVGSNGVKNGINYDENSRILTRLLAELNQKFPVIQETALCGFSGGAKMAMVYAMQSPIKKVIYCGAVTKIDNRDTLNLLGFAGTSDMNYSDLVAFGLAFENTKIKNTLIEWNGDHRFPDAEIMKDGFYWLSGQKIPNLASKGPKISEEALINEQGLKSKYYEAFKTGESIAWWDEEIAKLHQFKSQDPMYARLLGFIGLACFSYTTQSIQKGDKVQAAYYLHIYEKATPDNEDMKAFKFQLGLK